LATPQDKHKSLSRLSQAYPRQGFAP
jgi:hypothetical protein